MNDVTQNATVERARPWWKSMVIGFFADVTLLVAIGLGTGPAARDSRKAFDSGRYLIISGTSTRAGRAPITNIHCQPKRSTTRMPRSAVRTAPTWYPVIMVVVARPPRPRRAYSLINANAVGSTPPRPNPARNRRMPNVSGLGANAHSRVSTEKLITVHSMAFRRPIRSLTVPAASAPIMTPTRPITEMTDAEFGFRPQ